MATVPATARVVVIGAGIVGNSLVHHLARLGWSDIVQIDKGPLPNPGGSTGHASNFIFPVDHSREITDLTLDSVEQYQEMGVFTAVRRLRGGAHRGADGGAAPADVLGQGLGHRGRAGQPRSSSRRRCRSSTPTRSSARSGQPGVGVVDSLRAGTIMRERALETGALTVVPDRRGHRPRRRGRAAITRVRTDGGDIEAETVVIACGVWSPKIGDMAGVSIPLTPAVHQMISVGPCPQLAETGGRDLLPDRAGHGHVLLRAPARRRHGGRLLRAPRDPARARGHPLDRAVRSCRRPRCRSPPTTSTRSSSRPTS